MTARRILWSGGFDSTFLVVDALLSGFKVEPFYIDQCGSSVWWQKQRRERAAIERIIHALPLGIRKGLTKAPTDFMPTTADMWPGYLRLDAELRQRVPGDWFSAQSPMLAAVAEELDGSEIALVQGDDALDISDFLHSHALTFPIASLSKAEMLRTARRRGFDHILGMTWSCEAENQDAVTDACGVCAPCVRRIIPASGAA